MDKIERLNNVQNIYNSITNVFAYYINRHDKITREDKNRTMLALLSTHFLSLKENIILKHENLYFESLLNEDVLENLFFKVYKDFSEVKEYKGKEMNYELAIAIIRNKFAHGDFICDEINGQMIINLEGKDVHINIENLIEFYIMMEEELHRLYKDTTYDRNIIVNKSYLYIKNVLTTEKEVEEALKLFTLKKYRLRSMDNEIIPLDVKIIFDKLIENLKFSVFNGKDEKTEEENIRKYFEKNRYSLAVENNKIKDKELVDNIKSVFLDENIQKDINNDFADYSYIYGEIISNIVQDNSLMLNKGGLLNLIFLAGLISERNYDKLEFRSNFYNLSNEIIFGLILARFNTLYCYPFDDIYKKDNNYNLDREEYLDFSKLDLSELEPNILKLENKGIQNTRKILKSKIKCLKSLENSNINKNIQVSNMESIPNVKEEKKDIIEGLKQSIIDTEEKIKNLKVCIYELWEYYGKVKRDYKENYLYFKNLAIIEGIRNSMAHGNVQILNSASVTNFNDLKIRFTDEYENEICFDLTISLYEFQSLFEDYNVAIIEDFIDNVKTRTSVK